ncbi:TonB-dependent receptor [Aquimarina sp. RZ0]|uniref:TonB-dependent receptor domain-containing protein n=1 Tax=Aquimarina sp. RZ0 TaxID=2607730 RepID=UPI0011F2FCE8|nr:TonB-dependent receptor [Aquimarina sp. RZ0]KAA1243926.1 TonB-dependent receptor [Aquimarina sp. RZ0]
MRLRDYKVAVFFLLISTIVSAQYRITGVVTNQDSLPVPEAEVYNRTTGKEVVTNSDGSFEFTDVREGKYLITVFSFDYKISEKSVDVTSDSRINFVLKPLGEELSEVVITQRREKIFGLTRLKAVEGTAIYAGKKSEVVLLDNVQGNLASNNARQIYAQVAGLNIYENSVGGLQLNIGGRGLDPNRTANFNTRQNGYDISADVLGYPESYYTPPPEALSEIQVVRGAASLQYGTQFGGLINFKMKRPNPNKKIELVSRQTLGSFNLFTSFNSLGGTINKFSYYTYFNYKQGDGFRPNSEFDSKNAYVHAGYQISERTKIEGEFSYLKYLAKQPGGLTDTDFRTDPDFSNRTRNWFEVDWKLYALKLTHEFSDATDFSLYLFGLDASRSALGFRGIPGRLNTNPITDVDEVDSSGNFVNSRDLIVDNFRNWGAEARLLTRYQLWDKESVFLIGSKYYQAANNSRQGAGGLGTGPDFDFQDAIFLDYPNQSSFDFPNFNIAVFGENIFNFSDKFSVTPGFRFEHIKTESEGSFNQVIFDNAGNPIANNFDTDNRKLNRSFFLFGIGSSYKFTNSIETYVNISQNYRSVTFNDIRVVSPTFVVDPTIGDEEGFTADIGVRGKLNTTLSYDVSVFGLLYDDRIGIVFNDRAERVRGNIGSAFIYGLESLLDWNVWNTIGIENNNYRLNIFANTSLTNSEYTASEIPGVTGKKVEFIPAINLKTGLKFGYKNFLANVQYTYLSEQFTDVTNAAIANDGDNRNGIIGEIPAYSIVDLSFSYSFDRFKLETGINNLLDESYFTQRATGYPGPGIIPSEPLAWYATLQFKW